MRKIINVIIILFSVLLQAGLVKAQTPLTNAPDFTALDARGNYQQLYNYLNSGKYVLLDFFYNECLVCQEHVPEVNDAFVQFGCNTQDVVFMGINFNNTDGEVITFENDFGLFYPNISGIDGGGNDIIQLFQVIAFPTIILIAPDGSIPLQDIWPLTAVNIVDEVLSAGADTAICPSLSVRKPHSNNSFSVFPNPATDYVYVSSSKLLNNVTLQVSDVMGKQVATFNYEHFTKGRLSTSQLAPGIYNILLSGTDGILFRDKVIIK